MENEAGDYIKNFLAIDFIQPDQNENRSDHIRWQRKVAAYRCCLYKAGYTVPNDFKVFSDANYIDKLMAMHTTYTKENETLLSRYAWMGAKELGVKLGAGYKKSKF